MNQTETSFNDALREAGIVLDPAVLEKLLAFIRLLLDTNQTLNLTAITDYQEALYKHLYDSLIIMLRPEFQTARRILDLGSGAGIPALPLAVVAPDKTVVTLEATRKKVQFQEEACRQLGIGNCRPTWGRAEEAAQKGTERESYDLVVARAVAATNVLAELTIPFAKPGGFIALYKAKDYQAELDVSASAITTCGAAVTQCLTVELPMNYGTRALILLQKLFPTPDAYPRKSGIPQKRPL